jgi:hypothetical protein
LLAGAFAATLLMTVVSGVLAWHGLRRLLDVPHLPRPAGVYWALLVTWALLATGAAATTMTALLLRDNQRLNGRTEIGELRCEATATGHVSLEIRAAGAPPAAVPERYDLPGDACVVSVKEVQLRPGLWPLGVETLARVDAVGPIARPAVNPTWLTPLPASRAGVLGLVIQRTHAVQIIVPADPKQRFVVVAAPGEHPALQPTAI